MKRNETRGDVIVIDIPPALFVGCVDPVCGRRATRIVKGDGDQYGQPACGRHVARVKKFVEDNRRIEEMAR